MLSTYGNANRRSRTSLLLSFDHAELALLDPSCSLAILCRLPWRAYFLEWDAQASFFLSKVSHAYILTLVELSMTLRLIPGSSHSVDFQTWPHVALLT
jgi:hypothetical protein